jgi:hypothetical protein
MKRLSILAVTAVLLLTMGVTAFVNGAVGEACYCDLSSG